MEWYMSRPLGVRLLIFFAALGIIAAILVSSGVFNPETPEEPVTPFPTATTQPDPTETTEPVIPEPPTDVPSHVTQEPERVTTLSPADIAAAQEVVHEGLRHYYAFSTNESEKKREARLSQFFAGEVDLGDIPIGAEIIVQSGMRIDSQGHTVLEVPLSADDGLYATVIQVDLKLQFTMSGEKRAQVINNTIDVYVEASKNGSTWKITKLEEDEETRF